MGDSSSYELVDQNQDFMVIYKKPGIGFHREADEPGVFEQAKLGEQLVEAYPVHRLDKVTSGLLLIAKTAEANQELTEAFAQRRVEKYYLALSDKKPKKKQGLIKGDMVAARRGAWKLLPSSINPAVTQFFSCGAGQGLRLFLLKPHTGKTHQLRVALKSLGAPIVGDSLYGDALQAKKQDRCYLHAYSLQFDFKGKTYVYRELPREGQNFLSEEFRKAVDAYLCPDALPWPEL